MGDAPKGMDWPAAARALRERIGDSLIEPSVLAYLRAGSAGRLVVACSGGADSVCLLSILADRAEELGLKLHVAHYNHNWRGTDSDADAHFVASLADAFGLGFSEERRPEDEAAFTETTARGLRLDFLRRVAANEDCAAIAFGHQLDDVLETQLQRLGRGSGSDGLAAPRPVAHFEAHPVHLRPLLHLRAGAIRMSLNACSIPWREDSSNADLGIARNWLRKEIIPHLRECLGRDASEGAARSRRLLEEDASALDALAREQLPAAYVGAPVLSRQALRTVPRALVRRALASWLKGQGLIGSASARAMDVLVDTVLGGRRWFRMSLGNDFLLLDRDSLKVEPGGGGAPRQVLKAAIFQPGESVVLSDGAFLESEVVGLDRETRARIERGWVDPRTEAYLAVSGEADWQVRPWQPGDRFRPLGAPGWKKLKDWFIDRQIPRAERRTLPLVIHPDGEVVWVPGFPPAESRKIEASQKQALRLTYHASDPP